MSGDDAVRFLATAIHGPAREDAADRWAVPAGLGDAGEQCLVW
ncbi:hypothetical protein [Stappia sp. MMSF_3263]|nr:hypothetical protein [Stappia sp. MMSF_3263]